MSTGQKQLLLVAGAVALTIALYFASHNVQKDASANKTDRNSSGFAFDDILVQAKGQLKRQELDPINKVEDALSKDENNLPLLDSLGKLWDRVHFPVVSSHYFEQIAQLKPDEKTWIDAAYRYFDAFKSTDDSSLRVLMAGKAIESYKKVLELNPKNLDAKTDLGVCYAEGTGSPMQGILMLREVIQENPEHENAQYNLGILSVRSGQYDKAIDRFQKVLSINPGRLEARFMLGRVYMKLGDNAKALENLEMVKKQTTDPKELEDLNSLINQINNH